LKAVRRVIQRVNKREKEERNGDKKRRYAAYLLVKHKSQILCSKCSSIYYDADGLLYERRIYHNVAEQCRCFGRMLPTDLHLEGPLPRWWLEELKKQRQEGRRNLRGSQPPNLLNGYYDPSAPVIP